MGKIYASTEYQLEQLCSRGIIISDMIMAKQIIELENYFNLINGYKEPFLDNSYVGKGERYLAGTMFEEIYALYLFDRELRALFMRYILEVENSIKSVLAHVFSEKYGHDNYLKISSFDLVTRTRDRKTNAQKIGEISSLISSLQKEIAKQLSKNNPMISHYVLNYGYVPLWVLVNTLTLGTISTFYSYLKQKD